MFAEEELEEVAFPAGEGGMPPFGGPEDDDDEEEEEEEEAEEAEEDEDGFGFRWRLNHPASHARNA